MKNKSIRTYPLGPFRLALLLLSSLVLLATILLVYKMFRQVIYYLPFLIGGLTVLVGLIRIKPLVITIEVLTVAAAATSLWFLAIWYTFATS